MSKRNKIFALLLMAILLVACAGGAKKRETEKEAIFEVLSSKFIEMLSKNDSTKDNDDEPDKKSQLLEMGMITRLMKMSMSRKALFMMMVA